MIYSIFFLLTFILQIHLLKCIIILIYCNLLQFFCLEKKLKTIENFISKLLYFSSSEYF